MLVEMRALIPEIVGAHDCRVAPGIATADPALLQHRDIGDAVFLCEVVRRRQAVAATADDDDVVFGLWLRAAPGFLPVLVITESVAGERENRIVGFVSHGGVAMEARHPDLCCRGSASPLTF